MKIYRNEDIIITTKEQFEKFMGNLNSVLFEEFDCNITELYYDGGDYEFKLYGNNMVHIEQTWICIKDNISISNYQNILNALNYLKEHTNIELGIVDINIV